MYAPLIGQGRRGRYCSNTYNCVECRYESDCGWRQTCNGGYCQYRECRFDADCQEGKTCNGWSCQDIVG